MNASAAPPQEALKEKIAKAPKQPGCYLFKDVMGNIIYVGKSKLLRNRVRQYFHAASRNDERIRYLVREIADVEYLVTETETAALMQEYRLIKLYKPWFNSQLKRDTVHPYIRIDTACEYPTLTIVQDAADDGAAYYGCFHDVYDAQRALETIARVWKTPVCAKAPLPRRTCLFYQMNTCSGPCEGKVAPAAYRASVDEIICLFKGERVLAFDRLREEMAYHIKRLAFEKAESVQETIDDLEALQYRGKRLRRLPREGIVFALVRAYREPCFSLFHIRDGVLYGHAVFEKGIGAEETQKRIMAVLAASEPVADSDWIVRCVAEIYADKLFAVVPAGADSAALLQTVQDLAREFESHAAAGQSVDEPKNL